MIFSMKKLFLCLGITSLLVACGGGTNAVVTCTNQYWDGAVGTCLPAGWHVVNRAALADKGVPADVLVAFQADLPTSGQFPAVTVTRESLVKQMTSIEYSSASVLSVQGMQGYTKVDTQTIQIDGKDVTLHTFTAQPRADQPKIRFYQVSAAMGATGYTYTAATPVTIAGTLEQQILLILKNATLTAPKK